MLLYFQLKQQQKFLRRIATHRLLVVDKIWLLYLFEYALLIEDNLCEHLEWISMCWKHHWENVFLFIYFFAAFVPLHFFKNDLDFLMWNFAMNSENFKMISSDISMISFLNACNKSFLVFINACIQVILDFLETF